MLQYIDHRFHCNGISFAVPDGFFLDDATEDGVENGLLLLSPDHAFRLGIGIEHCVFSSEKELTDMLENVGYGIISRIQPISINSLTGHHAAYRGTRHQYYEARFDLSESENGTTALVLLVSTDKNILPLEKVTELIRVIDPKPDPCSQPRRDS